MQLVRSRLRRIDIYSANRTEDDYIGTKCSPKLLGFVYADVQPLAEQFVSENGGQTVKKQAKLYLRPDAGVQCGDLAAVYTSKPDCRITEVRRAGEYLAATAVHL